MPVPKEKQIPRAKSALGMTGHCVIYAVFYSRIEDAFLTMQRGGKTVGAYEAKTRLSELLQKVGAGEEVTITKHGAPVAKLVPVKKEAGTEQRAAAIRRIQKLSTGLSLGGLRVKNLVKQGRR